MDEQSVAIIRTSRELLRISRRSTSRGRRSGASGVLTVFMSRCTRSALQGRTIFGLGWRCSTLTTPLMDRQCYPSRSTVTYSLESSLRQFGTTLLGRHWKGWGGGRLRSDVDEVLHQISNDGANRSYPLTGVNFFQR